MDHHYQHQAVFQTNKRKKKLNSELNFADISRKFNENQKLKKEKKNLSTESKCNACV